MATPIRIKRSAVAGKKPTTSDLQLGELAVNFNDGKVFLKQDTSGVGVGTRIVEVGAGTTTFAGKTLFVTENGNCLLYTSPSPRDRQKSRMPSSA